MKYNNYNCTVIAVFCGRKIFPFRNLPQILLYFIKNLSLHHFLTQVIFKSDKAPKVSTVPFFYFLIILIVSKLPVCFKLLYWKLPSLLQLPAVTLHLNRVLSAFTFTRVTIDAVNLYRLLLLLFNLFSLSVFFSLVIDSYGQIPLFKTISIYNLVFSDKRMQLLYNNSFISYEYLVSLNFDVSLCKFWYSCFDIRLIF